MRKQILKNYNYTIFNLKTYLIILIFYINYNSFIVTQKYVIMSLQKYNIIFKTTCHYILYLIQKHKSKIEKLITKNYFMLKNKNIEIYYSN